MVCLVRLKRKYVQLTGVQSKVSLYEELSGRYIAYSAYIETIIEEYTKIYKNYDEKQLAAKEQVDKINATCNLKTYLGNQLFSELLTFKREDTYENKNYSSDVVDEPSYTKSEVGLANADDTSDISKPVSTAQQTAIDAAYTNANKYTDKKIADLIGSAPETMDTLEEVAAAIQENKNVEKALNESIGKKANQTELDTHTNNSTIHITASERTRWNEAKSHADSAHARTDATKVEKSTTNGNIKIDGTETTVYTHPSSSGNKHIPEGGKSGQILRWASDGTAKWGSDQNTEYYTGKNLTYSGTTFRLADVCDTVTDWNTATTMGFFMAYGASNAPVGSTWFYGQVIAHNTDYVRQILYRFAVDNSVNGGNCDRYERVRQNGSWGDWTNTSVRQYLPITGGTMIGDITFVSIGDTATSKGIHWSGSTDGADIFYRTDAKDAGRLVLNIADDANARIDFALNGTTKSCIDANGNFSGNASSATKATGVVDYGSTTKTIQIGYGGDGISGDNIKFIAGYTTGNGSDVNAKIKDVSKSALQSWLGLGSLAYSSATIPTIPSSLPANGGTADYAGLLSYQHNNEINFKGGKQANVFFNYRNADSDNQEAIDAIIYNFCNYSASTNNTTIKANVFDGKATGLKDTGNGKNVTASYSKDGLDYSAYTWLAAWNGYELQAVNKDQFLASSGGTISGTLKVSSKLATPEIHGSSNQNAHVKITSYNATQGEWYPSTTGVWSNGISDNKWYAVWSLAFNGASDRKLKTDIKNIDVNFADSFIDGLKPSAYKFKDNMYGKTHTGFIAQDVEDLILSLGMQRTDFAGLVKVRKKTDEERANCGSFEEINYDPDNFEGDDENYDYSLRYDDFIAPLVAYCQNLKKKNKDLEKKYNELTSTVNEILKKLN